MKKAKKYVLLHLNILLFSFTSIFSKLASMDSAKMACPDGSCICFCS